MRVGSARRRTVGVGSVSTRTPLTGPRSNASNVYPASTAQTPQVGESPHVQVVHRVVDQRELLSRSGGLRRNSLSTERLLSHVG